MFIHMFFVNVQSCSVLNACYIWIRYSVIQSRFLLTMPPFSCRHFLMIFFTRTFIFAWVTIAIFVHCIITASWDVLTRAAVLFSPHRRFRRYDIEALAHTAAQIASSQLYSVRRFTATNIEFYTVCWHDSLLLVDRHLLWLFDLTSGRLTVPSEPSSIANTAMHPHHRPSCILRAPHPSETHACRLPTLSSRSLPPSALQPRLYGASHLKSPSAITASSITSRRPRVHPAPHHRLLVSALFAASFASSTSYASLSSAAIAGHSRAR